MRIFLFVFMAALISCTPSREFDLQGHRGARGMMPENTIPAFLYALDIGVNTLEMDLALTGDGQLVVSHEPYMSSITCLTPSGDVIPDSLQTTYNIYKMNYEEVKSFDCGTKPNPRFPQQQKMAVFKPLLEDVIDTVENYVLAKNIKPVNYNIEIKSLPEGDLIFHPKPEEFSEVVFQFLNDRIAWSRITIQSFDFRVLQYFHTHYPQVKLAALVENDETYQQNLEALGFKPAIYSCDYGLLSQQIVRELQQAEIQVIPWTVNEPEEMKQLMVWGVDGLITDYPNRFKELIQDE